MKVIKMKLTELKKPEKNVRIHTEKQLKEFERSITMFGQIRPIVVDENNTILAGNGLYDTLLRMGKETADVYKYENLTENQKKKLMIADNKIFNLGIKNLDTLNSFLEELQGDLDIPGFDEEILKQMVSDADEVTEKISEYGTLDDEEIQNIKDNAEKKEREIEPNINVSSIDGFHRWSVAGQEPLLSMLGGRVPVVIVDHKDKAEDMYGTVTHNRARGTHLLEPMKAIVKELINDGKTVEEIGKQLGMRPEEIFRLSDFSKEDFLQMMIKPDKGFSKAEFITKV